nr:hypothetical protein GCM10011355_19340 [Aquisalinus luteolus]
MGRVFNQSELVLGEKRRIYESFLIICPTPNDAYGDDLPLSKEYIDAHTLLRFYGEPNVHLAVNRYMDLFLEAQKVLSMDSDPLDSKFKELARAHNDIILEMRRDALGWSAFGYRGKSRLPEGYAEKVFTEHSKDIE